MENLRNHWFKLATGLLVVGLIGVFAYETLKMGNQNPNLGIKKAAPSFSLTNNSQKQVSFNESDGKVRLVYFFFSSCPDICSPTTFQLSKVQDLLKEKGLFGNNTAMYSISVDPTRDTAEVLTKYAAQFHADPAGWTFLRGTEAEIDNLTKKYGIMLIKEKNGDFTHSNTIFLIDGKGNIRHNYNGSDIELTPKKIVSDIQQLLNEK